MIITLLFDQQEMVTNLRGKKSFKTQISLKPCGCYKSSETGEKKENKKGSRQ